MLKTDGIAWPKKTREMHNHHMDSTVWNALQIRDGDIVVATWGKSGTTWVQQIIGQLIFDGAEVPVAELSPWVDLRAMPRAEMLEKLEAQTHRRFLKTHLPVDALRFSSKAKYIYVGRDGRDVLWSVYHHHVNANQLWYDLINDTPGRIGPPIGRPNPDIRKYYHDWLDGDGFPFWPFWHNVQSWWDVRHLPNVMLLHFAELKADLEGGIRKIAAFLDIEPSAESWPRIVRHSTFAYMKENADRAAPLAGAVFEGGGKTFINKGSNGRWRDVLSADDIDKYDRLAAENLSPGCAHWLATGEMAE